MVLKERILEKAEELFIRNGVKRITMDDIATVMGISKKTIYQFFADKSELVSIIFDKHISMSRENCIKDIEKSENAIHEVLLGSETFCATMQYMNRHVLFDLEKYHSEIFKRFTDFENEFLYNLIYQNLERGIRENLYRKDLNLNVISKFRLLNILLPMNGEVFPAHRFSFSDVENELVTHYLNGIATPQGVYMVQHYISKAKTKEPVLN